MKWCNCWTVQVNHSIWRGERHQHPHLSSSVSQGDRHHQGCEAQDRGGGHLPGSQDCQVPRGGEVWSVSPSGGGASSTIHHRHHLLLKTEPHQELSWIKTQRSHGRYWSWLYNILTILSLVVSWKHNLCHQCLYPPARSLRSSQEWCSLLISSPGSHHGEVLWAGSVHGRRSCGILLRYWTTVNISIVWG